MGNGNLTRTLLAAWIASCGAFALHQARAEPPLQKITITMSRESKVSHDAAPPISARLDLRPPVEVHTRDAAAPTPAAAEFFAGNHRRLADDSATRYDPHVVPSAESTHIMSPLQNLAHNFRQEGLPVAKLFQSNDALLHLGLNPKGKPGLWLVHKLH
jgi:hypothetical protein